MGVSGELRIDAKEAEKESDEVWASIESLETEGEPPAKRSCLNK